MSNSRCVDAADILPDDLNSVVIRGVEVRMGTVAAVVANSELYENESSSSEDKDAAIGKIKTLVPSLRAQGLLNHINFKNPDIQVLMEKETHSSPLSPPQPSLPLGPAAAVADIYVLADKYYQKLGEVWDHETKDFKVLYKPLYECDSKQGSFEAHHLAVSAFDRWEQKFKRVDQVDPKNYAEFDASTSTALLSSFVVPISAVHALNNGNENLPLETIPFVGSLLHNSAGKVKVYVTGVPATTAAIATSTVSATVAPAMKPPTMKSSQLPLAVESTGEGYAVAVVAAAAGQHQVEPNVVSTVLESIITAISGTAAAVAVVIATCNKTELVAESEELLHKPLRENRPLVSSVSGFGSRSLLPYFILDFSPLSFTPENA